MLYLAVKNSILTMIFNRSNMTFALNGCGYIRSARINSLKRHQQRLDVKIDAEILLFFPY